MLNEKLQEEIEGKKKLLPCPFCGTEPTEQQYKRNGWEIKCPKCVVKYQQRALRFTIPQLRELMAETWNERADKKYQTAQEKLDEAVELLETSLEDYRQVRLPFKAERISNFLDSLKAEQK